MFILFVVICIILVWHAIAMLGYYRQSRTEVDITKPNVTLPNGMRAFSFAHNDAHGLYHELFERPSYWKHGITVNDNDLIIDIGANIGFFSLSLAAKRKGLNILAFEPIPSLCRVAKANALRHINISQLPDDNDCDRIIDHTTTSTPSSSTSAASVTSWQQLAVEANNKMQVFPLGLNNEETTLRLTFDPFMPMASGSMYDEIYNKESTWHKATTYEWMHALVADAASAGHEAAKKILPYLEWWVTRWPLTWYLRYNLYTTHQLQRPFHRYEQCHMTTLSAVMRNHIDWNAHQSISLVKIDIEGAEWLVLQGLKSDDFARIDQFVMEVHDVDSRCEKIKQLLDHHGYHVWIDQEDWHVHKLMRLYTIFARRRSLPSVAECKT